MANTIIDSLFLELGIDTTKFSKDQAQALAKIQKFESQTKRASGKAGDAIKTVGAAFRDLAKDSRIGASAGQVDNLATKLKNLGVSMRVAGGAGTPLGMMAQGLGSLLSPTTLGIAAVGLLGKEMWDLNKVMTANNATMDRQAQLSGMNAANLWAWGEAAKTVGANPQDVTGGISGLQTAIAGMMVGAGNAAPQLTALARLGLRWNARNGMDDAQVAQMFTRVHQMAAAKGYKNLGGLRAITSPIMNDAMFAIATNTTYEPSQLQKQIAARSPQNLNDILQKSLKSQSVLGELGIQKDILAETAYGGEQGLMQASVQLLTSILGGITDLVDYFVHPASTSKKIYDATVDVASRAIDDAVEVGHIVRNRLLPSAMRSKMSRGMQFLMDNGASKDEAAAMIGNMTQESTMNPLARNGSHVGLGQWDKTRQADFAKKYHYQMGSSDIPESQQSSDQLLFFLDELRTTQRQAASAMAKARDLMGKTSAIMNWDERPGDNSLAQRFSLAQQASRLADVAGMVQSTNARATPVQHTVTSETHIGEVNVHTPATDPKSHVDAVANGIMNHPFINPAAQGTVSLATRGQAG